MLSAMEHDLVTHLKDILEKYRFAMLVLKQTPDAFETSSEVVAARELIARAEGER